MQHFTHLPISGLVLSPGNILRQPAALQHGEQRLVYSFNAAFDPGEVHHQLVMALANGHTVLVTYE